MKTILRLPIRLAMFDKNRQRTCRYVDEIRSSIQITLQNILLKIEDEIADVITSRIFIRAVEEAVNATLEFAWLYTLKELKKS